MKRFLPHIWQISQFGMASRVVPSRRTSRAVMQSVGVEALEQRLALAVPSLVVDIVPGGVGSVGGGWGSSVPASPTEFKDAIYFAASNSSAARGIWKTDGTAAGTVMVATIRPQREGPWYAKDTISQLTAAGDYLFFREIQGSSLSSPSTKLWRTDGTSSGTLLLRDFGAQIANLTDVDGKLFFTVRAGNTSDEIWQSDGTESGTVRLGVFASVSPNRYSNNLNTPETFQRFASIGGDIFFSAQQVANGPTALVKWNSQTQSLQTLHERVNAYSLTAANGKVLYAVGVLQSGIAGPTELWQTDGTEQGTVRVATMSERGYSIQGIVQLGGVTYVGAVGPRLSDPGKVMTVSGAAFMTVYATQRANLQGLVVRPWGSDVCIVERDGSQAASFSRLSAVSLAVTHLGEFRSWGGSGGAGDVFNDQDYIVAANGRLYFPASPAVSSIFSSSDTELWESDGSVAGTRVLDVTPDFSSSPSNLAAFRGGILYRASSLATGVELWTLRNNDSPTNVTLSSASVAENAGANAVVGTFTSIDPDAGNAFTYTLVSGTGSTDNASFNISGNQLRATASLDFETKRSYSVRVRTTDQGGLFFEKAFTITVTNDTTPPAPPTIVRVIDDVPRFVGNVLPGGLTNDNRLRVVGTAEPGSTVAVRNGGTTLGTAIATAQGSWEITTITLADGGYALTAIATDAENNSSGASAPSFGFTVDTVGPATPVILTVTDNVGAVTGNVASGGRTDDTTLRIVGTAAPMSRVTVRSGNAVLRTVYANDSGNWAIVTDPLLVRLHNLNAVAQDEAGNNSAPSGTHTVTIDQTRPTILSFGSTTPAGSYGQGSEIAIFARSSERMRAGSAIDVTLNTGAVVRLSTSSERSELNGTYRVASGALASPLSIVSVTNVSPTASDIAGNLVAGLPSMPVILAGINVA